MDPRNWLGAARAHPCGVLLAVQLLGILLYPFMEDSVFGRAAFSTFGLFVLFLAALAVRSTPALNWVAFLLGGPVVVLTILEALQLGGTPVALASSLTHAAFYLYTAVGLIAYMFADNWVTRDELFATGAAFTVLVWGFAYVYQATQIVYPGSFMAANDAEDARTWMELLFMSVTTMSGTGLSDIVPVQAHARSVIMIQQITGMGYLALVVARLVGLTIIKFR